MTDTQEVEDLLDLAIRFLTTCNALFARALQCQDTFLAIGVSRTALSVTMDSVTALGYSPGLELANTWFDRLQALARSNPENDPAIEKTLKWAEKAISEAFSLENQPEELPGDTDD